MRRRSQLAERPPVPARVTRALTSTNTASAKHTQRITTLAPVVPAGTAPTATVVAIHRHTSEDLLRRLSERPPTLAVLPGAAAKTESSIEDRLNAAIGCRSSEVALALLAQVIGLEHRDFDAASDEQIDTWMTRGTAMLAELQPATATEAMLAAQMVGTQRAAMTFLERAMNPDQTLAGVDANVLRATRLMRLFSEQVDTVAKLKGKGGQQRVVVEHVNVAAGGQAIVGIVVPGGRGPTPDDHG